MQMVSETATVADVGEKEIIERILRPLFNPDNDADLVGDDCAVLEIPSDAALLASTDRVPADLTSFKAGVLNFEQLGRYLGVLNLSDIAACGGTPTAILFNCGLPPQLRVSELVKISRGLNSIASEFRCKIAGGDITSASELSLSATVIGHVARKQVLRRSGARIGDSIFVSKPIGLTPAALDLCFRKIAGEDPTGGRCPQLEKQFTEVLPELSLGHKLVASDQCTSCMDNTDGLGQSLMELARESRCALIVEHDKIRLSPPVISAAKHRNMMPLEFAFGPGADFALVGTLNGSWSNEMVRLRFGPDMQIIGRVADATGVYLESAAGTRVLNVLGWNYFTQSS